MTSDPLFFANNGGTQTGIPLSALIYSGTAIFGVFLPPTESVDDSFWVGRQEPFDLLGDWRRMDLFVKGVKRADNIPPPPSLSFWNKMNALILHRSDS
jgi:hypothetical protein